VTVPGLLESLQSPRHEPRLSRGKSPLKPKPAFSGAPATVGYKPFDISTRNRRSNPPTARDRGCPIQAFFWLEWGSSHHPSRHSLLQRLECIGKRAVLGLADKQVNVLRHDHISVNAKPVTSPHTFQRGLESPHGGIRSEERLPVITRECHEVTVPGLLESLQSPRHEPRLSRGKSPLKPKPGLSGPPVRRFKRLLNGVRLLQRFRRIAEMARAMSFGILLVKKTSQPQQMCLAQCRGSARGSRRV